jgi:tryptophan 2,3-dioxygenase
VNETKPAAKPLVDLSDEGIHWDLTHSLSYSQYLGLDKLLDAQHPLSYEHDEMLFIVIHQVSELWMKLCLHELNTVVDCVRRDDLGPTFKRLARVSTIQQQLLQACSRRSRPTIIRRSATRSDGPRGFSRRNTGCSSS